MLATRLQGLTPLLKAAKNSKWLAVKHLARSGASVVVKDPQNGFTALHYAAANDQVEVIDELMDHGLNHGADVNASDAQVHMHCAPQKTGKRLRCVIQSRPAQ